MAPETLGVDPVSLSRYGNDMLSAATDIPVAPAPFTAGGADPISMKIMSTLPSLEAPIQTGLPEVKAEATKTATSIVASASMYETTDEQLAKQIEQHTFDRPGGPSVGGGLGDGAQGVAGLKGNPAETTGFSTPNRVGGRVGGDTPVSAPPATTNAPGAPAAGSGASGAGTSAACRRGPSGAAAAGAEPPAAEAPGASTSAASAASGAGAMGQMGQMISMPMQMVGQAIGMAAALPQTDHAGGRGSAVAAGRPVDRRARARAATHSAGDAQLAADHKGDESPTAPRRTGEARPRRTTARLAGQPHAERVARGASGTPRSPLPPAPPAEPKPPAQTRPAESGPETARVTTPGGPVPKVSAP